MTKPALIALVLLSGCTLYDDDDDDPCYYPAGAEPAIAVPAQELRDPYTGQCIYQPYDPYVPPGCPNAPQEDRAPAVYYDYATCYSYCEGLDEATCKATDACRAIYADGCNSPAGVGDCVNLMYAGCWGTAPSGPIRGVPCAGLDALQCSQHDDCQALHQNQTLCGTAPCSVVAANFVSCQTEGPLPPPPPPPPPPCATLDERGCIERADCAPLYEGSGCTCDAAGCACSIWTFVSCDDAA